MWLTDGQPLKSGNDSGKAGELSKVGRSFFARPNLPRRTNTIPLSPVTEITFTKKYAMQQFLLLLTPPRFFIGYMALNILHIQGLLHETPYVFKFYADICQVQDFFYLVTYIVCRKNIVFDKKKKNIFFCSLRLYPTANLSDVPVNIQFLQQNRQPIRLTVLSNKEMTNM